MIATATTGLRVGQRAGRGYVRPTTTKQATFIDTLLQERIHSLPYTSGFDVNIRHASRIIGHLLACPKKDRPAPAVAVATERLVRSIVDVEAGIYFRDGEVVKVQRAVHGSGNMYAKRLDKNTGRFEYSPGLIRRITPDMKMTLEQAHEYGALYGVCCNCGRTLTDETSIEAGIGPVCAKRFA